MAKIYFETTKLTPKNVFRDKIQQEKWPHYNSFDLRRNVMNEPNLGIFGISDFNGLLRHIQLHCELERFVLVNNNRKFYPPKLMKRHK